MWHFCPVKRGIRLAAVMCGCSQSMHAPHHPTTNPCPAAAQDTHCVVLHGAEMEVYEVRLGGSKGQTGARVGHVVCVG